MQLRRLLMVILFLLLGLPVAATNSQESQFLWTFDTGGEVWSSPTMDDDGTLYIGTDSGILYAMGSVSGEVLWAFEAGDFVRSTPAIDATQVYVAADTGYLYAIDKASGSEVWRFDIGTAEIAKRRERDTWRMEFEYQQSSPVVYDGVVYVGSEREFVYAIDAETGQEIWRFDVDVNFKGPVRNTPGVTEDVVVAGGFMGDFYGIDRETGEELWYRLLDGNINTRSVVVDDVVYVGTRGFWLYALDVATGEERWSVEYVSSWVESSPLVVEGRVYSGSSDAERVFAWDAETGTPIWEYEVYQYSWSSPAYGTGAIYIGVIGPEEGYMLALDAEAGEELWRLPVGDALAYNRSGVVSSPLVADGVLYFGSLDGNVYALPVE